MIAALLNQRYRDGTILKDHEIAHIMIALLMAGQHTSSATGSWTLLHLAANPDVAYVSTVSGVAHPISSIDVYSEALFQEQVKFFGTPDGRLRSMTYDELRQLPVMDSVIRETLRIHPPIHSMMRKVRDDISVPTSLSSPSDQGVFVVPKGHYVLASPAVSQMDPRIWKDPQEWDPSRWSDPEGVAAQAYKDDSGDKGEKVDYGFGIVSKGTESPYQPFGAGRHRCIGEQVMSLVHFRPMYHADSSVP